MVVAATTRRSACNGRQHNYEEIRGKYLELARRYHPDKNGDPNSNVKFQELNLAYTTLSNAVSRADHDRFLGYTDTLAHDGHHHLVSVKVNTCSLTLEITEGLAQVWVDALREFYPDHAFHDRKENGQQIRGEYISPDSEVMGTISVTLYETTSHIHTQGSSYILWLEEHLPVLEDMVMERAMKDERLAKLVQAQAQARKSSRAKKMATSSISPASGARGGAHIHNCSACHTEIDITSGAAWQCELCRHCFHVFCVQSGPGGADRNCVVCI